MDSEGPWQDIVKIPTQDAFDNQEEEPKDVVKVVTDPTCLCRIVFWVSALSFFKTVHAKTCRKCSNHLAA